MEKAVVLCSGGLNSAVVSGLAAQEYQIALLHVRVGHRASAREESAFQELARSLGVKQADVVEMPHLAAMSRGARFDERAEMPVYSSPMNLLCSGTAIPGMLSAILAAGHGYAAVLGATKLFIGISENLGPPAPPTHQIWPDYSREFLSLAGQLIMAASPDLGCTLEAPLIDLTRKEIILLGKQVGTPFAETWSCLASGDGPCGQCIGCATRSRGFLDASMVDPLLEIGAVA